MNKSKLLLATILVTAALVPALAQAGHHHRYHQAYVYGHPYYDRLPYPISYLHNYGPGAQPGTFAYYDGPARNHCYQGSAAYLGQDRRRHPCF